jgi:hypothetical protein
VSDLEQMKADLAAIQAKMAQMHPDAILARVREMATPDVARVLDAPPLPAPAPSSSSPAAPSDAPADYDPWAGDPSPDVFAAMSQAEMAAVDRIRSLATSGASTLDDRIEATMRWQQLREEHNARREQAAAEAARQAEIEASPELQMRQVVQRQLHDFRSQLGRFGVRETFLRGSELGVFDRTREQLAEQGFTPADVAKLASVQRRVIEVDGERFGISGTVERSGGRRYTAIDYGQDIDEAIGRYGVLPAESGGEGGDGGA